jgi:hypothetical protein
MDPGQGRRGAGLGRQAVRRHRRQVTDLRRLARAAPTSRRRPRPACSPRPARSPPAAISSSGGGGTGSASRPAGTGGDTYQITVNGVLDPDASPTRSRPAGPPGADDRPRGGGGAVTVTPVPTLTLDGQDLAAGPNPDGTWPALMALDGATVTWGRDRGAGPAETGDRDGVGVRPGRRLGRLPGPDRPALSLRWTAGEHHPHLLHRPGRRGHRHPHHRARPRRQPGARRHRPAGLHVAARRPGQPPPPIRRRGRPRPWPPAAPGSPRWPPARSPGSAPGRLRPGPARPGAHPAGDGTVLAALEALLGNAGADRWTYDPDTRPSTGCRAAGSTRPPPPTWPGTPPAPGCT